MKKILSIILVAVMLLSLGSCGFVSMKGEEVVLEYDVEQMEANLNQLKKVDGLLVELFVTSYESGNKPVTERVAYAETEDQFYYSGDGIETYYDFSDDTKTVIFDRNDDGVWVRTEIIYAETGMTREQMETNCQLQASTIFGYLGNYQQFNGQKVKKTTTTVAGRTCDEFNITAGLFGYGFNYVFAIDVETGMCLKWQLNATAGMEGSASVSFNCNRFESPYTILLPSEYIDADAETESQGGEEQSGEEQSGEEQSGEEQSGEEQSGEEQSGEEQSDGTNTGGQWNDAAYIEYTNGVAEPTFKYTIKGVIMDQLTINAEATEDEISAWKQSLLDAGFEEYREGEQWGVKNVTHNIQMNGFVNGIAYVYIGLE